MLRGVTARAVGDKPWREGADGVGLVGRPPQYREVAARVRGREAGGDDLHL